MEFFVIHINYPFFVRDLLARSRDQKGESTMLSELALTMWDDLKRLVGTITLIIIFLGVGCTVLAIPMAIWWYFFWPVTIEFSLRTGLAVVGGFLCLLSYFVAFALLRMLSDDGYKANKERASRRQRFR